MAVVSTAAQPMSAGTPIVVFGESEGNKWIADELSLDGFDVRRACDREFLRECCDPGDVRLVIFGRSRHATALEVLREVRAGALAPAVSPMVRVLWIAPTDRATDVLRAFDAGSDDVMRSPFIQRELVARVGSLVRRRAGAESPTMIEHEDLVIDLEEREVTFAGRRLPLRRMEYDLLVRLAGSPTRVFTKDELLAEVWGFHSTCATRTVDTHACRLRRKLAEAGAAGWVSNIHGVGYRLRG